MLVDKGEYIDYADHWDRVFQRLPENKLGWFENDFAPSLELIDQAGLSGESRILIAGAGNTHLLDKLVEQGYGNLVACDISKTAIDCLTQRLGNRIKYIVDDLTNPTVLKESRPVDLWFDRAVMHFFTEAEQLIKYWSLINQLVKPGGYTAMAEFAEDGATKCSGLDLKRYSVDEMQDFLGDNFSLKHSFRHLYTMPSGELRAYNYALFKKVKEAE